MVVNQTDLIREVKQKLDAAGLNLNHAVVKLIIESEHEQIRECLKQGNTVEIEGSFTARVKDRAYRDPGGRGRQNTVKIDAQINQALRNEIMFNKNLLDDAN